MLELRWLNKGTHKVLQYRTIESVLVSDHTYPNGEILSRIEKVPGKWQNVPEITEASINVPQYE